jgi:hypothetical protein
MPLGHLGWLLAPSLALALAACGDDAGGSAPDGGTADAGASITPCPPTAEEGCPRATEVCVQRGPIGPSIASECRPVPGGCEGDRSCDCLEPELCPEGTFSCSEPGDNVIFCDNGSQ